MKEKLLTLTGILAILCPGLAQYPDLLNDRNISWVAESTADFSFNPVTYTFRFFGESEYEQNNELNVIQLSIPPIVAGLYQEQDLEQYFSKQIFTALREGAYPLFEDEALEIPLPKETLDMRLAKVDTVAYDTDDFNDTGWRIITNDLSSGEIVAFRVRQVYYYDKVAKLFGSRILAMAPLIDKRDESGNYIETMPLVWMKIEHPPKNRDKMSPTEYSYVFETKMKGNAPKLQGFMPKKGRMDFLTFIVNEVAQPSHRIFDHQFIAIDPVNLQGYVLSTDTVSTYNPETSEEKTEIIQRNAIRDVERICFVQQWFYDDRKKLFFNRIVAIAPLRSVKDPEGNVQYRMPLFYMINE